MIDDNDEDPLAADIELEPPHVWHEKKEPGFDPVRRKWTCPECGGDLVRRIGKYGEFYGCVKFPDCRYTTDAKMIEQTVYNRENNTNREHNDLIPPELKPCPFCGGEATYIIGALKGRYTWNVACTRCHAVGGYKEDRSKRDAGDDWNARWSDPNEADEPHSFEKDYYKDPLAIESSFWGD